MTSWIRRGDTDLCPECGSDETVHERKVVDGEDIVDRVVCKNCPIIIRPTGGRATKRRNSDGTMFGP